MMWCCECSAPEPDGLLLFSGSRCRCFWGLHSAPDRDGSAAALSDQEDCGHKLPHPTSHLWSLLVLLFVWSKWEHVKPLNFNKKILVMLPSMGEMSFCRTDLGFSAPWKKANSWLCFTPVEQESVRKHMWRIRLLLFHITQCLLPENSDRKPSLSEYNVTSCSAVGT